MDYYFIVDIESGTIDSLVQRTSQPNKTKSKAFVKADYLDLNFYNNLAKIQEIITLEEIKSLRR